jgi:hypothetical protein
VPIVFWAVDEPIETAPPSARPPPSAAEAASVFPVIDAVSVANSDRLFAARTLEDVMFAVVVPEIVLVALAPAPLMPTPTAPKPAAALADCAVAAIVEVSLALRPTSPGLAAAQWLVSP